MGFYYDIYGLIDGRDKEAIELFLERYSHRESIENQAGSDISILDIDGSARNIVQVNTLSAVINYGVEHPTEAFAFYLNRDNLKEDFRWLILKFTFDSAIIVGITIDDELETGENSYARAFEIEQGLKNFEQVCATSIQVESPPADTKPEFFTVAQFWEKMNEEMIKNMGLGTNLD